MLDKALKSFEVKTLNESEIEKRMRKYGLCSIAIFMIVFIAFLMILIYSNKRYIKNNVEVITRNLKSYIENQNDEKDRINENIKQSLNNKYSFEYINDNVYAILRNFILKNENSKTAHIMFSDKSIYSLDKTGKLVLEKNSRLYIEIEKMLEKQEEILESNGWIYEASKREYYKLYSVKLKDIQDNMIGIFVYSSMINEPSKLIKEFEKIYPGMKITLKDTNGNVIYTGKHAEDLKIENVEIYEEINTNDDSLLSDEEIENSKDYELKLDSKKVGKTSIKDSVTKIINLVKSSALEMNRNINYTIFESTNVGINIEVAYGEVIFENIKKDLGFSIALFSVTLLFVYWLFVLYKNDTITQNILKLVYSISLILAALLLVWTLNEKFNDSKMKEALIHGSYISNENFNEEIINIYLKQKIKESALDKNKEEFFYVILDETKLQNKILKNLNVVAYNSNNENDELVIKEIQDKLKNNSSMLEVEVDEINNKVKFKRYIIEKYLNNDVVLIVTGDIDAESFDFKKFYFDEARNIRIFAFDKIIQSEDGKIKVYEMKENKIREQIIIKNISATKYNILDIELEMIDPLTQLIYVADYSRRLVSYLTYVILLVICLTILSIYLITKSIDKLIIQEAKNEVNNYDMEDYDDVKIIDSSKVFTKEEDEIETKDEEIQVPLLENTYRSFRTRNKEVNEENKNKSTYDYISKKYMRASTDKNNNKKNETIFDIDELKIFQKYSDAIGIEKYDNEMDENKDLDNVNNSDNIEHIDNDEI